MSYDKVIKQMRGTQLTLKELGITKTDIRAIKDMGHMVVHQASTRGRVYAIKSVNENNSLFISKASSKPHTEKWVELSDIHVGSIQFDEQGFRDIMKRALDRGFRNFHISGDLCDGYRVYPGHMNNLRYHKSEDQAEFLTEILLDYPKANFVAITGNHDFSYVKAGGINPISIIEKSMELEGRKFVFLNNFAGDLIIRGMLKRMVHLLGGRAYAKSYPIQTYIRNLMDSHGENVYVGGNKYRIRCIQAGHLHFEVAFESAGIRCTHPGNFQFPNDYTIRGGLVGPQGTRFTTVIIQDSRILEYTSTFVKPRRNGF